LPMDLAAELRALLSRRKFGWFGQRSLDCIGLDDYLDFELIMCCDYGLDTELIASRTGAPVISLESETGIRDIWNNLSLEKLFRGKTA